MGQNSEFSFRHYLCTVHIPRGSKFPFVFDNLIRQDPCPFLNLQPLVDGLVFGVFGENVDKVEHGGVCSVWGIENPGGVLSGIGLRDMIDNGSLMRYLLRPGHAGFLPFGDSVILHDF